MPPDETTIQRALDTIISGLKDVRSDFTILNTSIVRIDNAMESLRDHVSMLDKMVRGDDTNQHSITMKVALIASRQEAMEEKIAVLTGSRREAVRGRWQLYGGLVSGLFALATAVASALWAAHK